MSKFVKLNSYDYGDYCKGEIWGISDLGVIAHRMSDGFRFVYFRGSIGEDTHLVRLKDEVQYYILDPDSWHLHWGACTAGDWATVFATEDDAFGEDYGDDFE